MLEKFFFMDMVANPQSSDETHRITLLSGPPSSGKTPLLFQFAYNSAMENDSTVFILCNRRRLETNPPFFSQGVDPFSEIFSRIQIKYVHDDQELKNFFAALHLLDVFPVSIIVDDFADFFDERTCQDRYNHPRGRDLAIVRTLALCGNAMDHANVTEFTYIRGSKRGNCQLLLSDTHKGDSPKLLYIYKRWVTSIYSIKGDGSGSFILKKKYSESDVERGDRMISARYSIAPQRMDVVLEGIIEGVDG